MMLINEVAVLDGLNNPSRSKMKQYRAEQVTKYLLRYTHCDRRKFKEWLKEQREFKEWLEQQIKREDDEPC